MDNCLLTTGCCDTSRSRSVEGIAGEAALECGRGPDCDKGRDKGLGCLIAVVGVRMDLALLEWLPSRGGVCGTELLTGGEELLRAKSDEGDKASLWAWNGFLKTVFCFFGAEVGFVVGERPVGTIGLTERLAGTKSSPRTSTKLDGKSPIIRLSRRSRPIHH